jgi:hypothetical protein
MSRYCSQAGATVRQVLSAGVSPQRDVYCKIGAGRPVLYRLCHRWNTGIGFSASMLA